MNFYQHQDKARRITWKLVVLFAVAVVGLVALTNLLVAAVLGYNGSLASVDSHLFVQISIAVVGTIAMVILFKWLQLRGGGKVVAEQMGGVLLSRDSRDRHERQLLNVVEEMAIAAGMPVPPVYLLEEQGINAFAAGYSANDAVIGITRGALQALDRDQLQGVIGHEFSHILHGDTRINLRLIAVLAGIVFIGQAGRVIMRGSSRSRISVGPVNRGKSKGSGGIVLLGLGLTIIGYLGVMIGNLIRAAVSRQREFLADASAVQYTRNPEGIAGALQVIGGSTAKSYMDSSRAEQNSHLFFGSVLLRKASSAFATHPPLEQRIQRILPNWDGEFLEPPANPQASSTDSGLSQFAAGSVTPGLQEQVPQAGQLTEQNLQQGRELIAGLPEVLDRASRHPYYARALVLAMVVSKQSGELQDRQLQLIDDGIRLRQRVQSLLPAVADLKPEQRLPLLELSVPALKQQSFRQYQQFDRYLQEVVAADGELDRFEWMLQRLLKGYLESSYSLPGSQGGAITSLHRVAPECFEILSLVAHEGHDGYYPAETAFYKGMEVLNIGPARIVREEELTLPRIDSALNRLQRLSPLLKQRLLNACAACIEHDNKVTAKEKEWLRVVAVALDCPIPVI
ncbi:M48 family metalloprotease [Porticoccus sp. W117]|uniref:M48 family metalloprotease n=1 Tax=Porticoccus sp. W117 TaxID=3054777 RepID=UPI002596CD1E|nr:M48 family metalloprotease [Porticoccus sp. W117]MDM3871494.1 M48 family metalloprotease [Porticoccus sp. W117]